MLGIAVKVIFYSYKIYLCHRYNIEDLFAAKQNKI